MAGEIRIGNPTEIEAHGLLIRGGNGIQGFSPNGITRDWLHIGHTRSIALKGIGPVIWIQQTRGVGIENGVGLRNTAKHAYPL